MSSEADTTAQNKAREAYREPVRCAGPSRLSATIAVGNGEVRQALALRYEVFTREMGANIDAHDGLDCDDFDAYCEHLIGCASIGMSDGSANAAAVFSGLPATAMTGPDRRVIPKFAFPLATIAPAAQAVVPPLLHGYLALGAQVAGPPAWDPHLNTADLLVLLPMSRLPARYVRHFLSRPLNG